MSLRVPPEGILRRKGKDRTDAEPPVAFGKVEKEVESSDAGKEKARLSKVAIWEANWETAGSEVVVGSGGRYLNQAGDAGTNSFVLGDEVAGNWFACTQRPNQTEGWDFQVQTAPRCRRRPWLPARNLAQLLSRTRNVSRNIPPFKGNGLR
jgi:hypothetical protein